MVFNRHPLGNFNPAALLTDLKAVHFSTLCRQYGLDTALINPAMAQLAVDTAVNDSVPYFILRYQPEHRPPIVVNRVDLTGLRQDFNLDDVNGTQINTSVRMHVLNTREAYTVNLEDAQVKDFGLVLGYEVARWMAYRGDGLVLGLDGVWYRLNAYQAFLPLV